MGLLVGLLIPIDDERLPERLGSAELNISSALFGVIIAGLSIVVVFLNKQYVKVLHKAGAGILEDLFPFWYTAVLAVISIILATILVSLGPIQNECYLRVLVGASSWFFLYTLFASLNLIGSIVAHGINRTRQIIMEEKQKEDNTD